MRKTGLQLWFALMMMVSAVLACSFNVSTASIKNVTMARDANGKEPTTTFAQDDTFHCLVQLANAPDDTVVKAAWTAVEAEGVEPNFFIDENELTSRSGTLHFKLTNDKLWPKGQYKVDLYLNGKLSRTVEFKVE
ncbi:MAG: hypothetical protein M5U01_43645 [Ardenticatenaceae bacterium]|nr:hypothetical protein [Ardenticatenaceae bacterium]HBY95770.1 hypothetical protein [Chloroflexota bacterium]